jgi:hypothetical protein
MLVHLVEIQERRLHLELACSSMFVFCTTKLGLSEGTANRRIMAARLIRRFPRLLEAIASGRIHLSNVLRLHDLFTESNVDDLVDAAAGKSKREVEELIARMAPKPPVAPSIRIVPEQRPLPSEPGPGLPPPVAVSEPARADAKVSPLSDARYKLELTIDDRTLERLEYARSLMRHKNPSGDISALFAIALEAVIEKVEKGKLGKTSRGLPPRPTKDPATVTQSARREVVERDGFRCSYVSPDGERCGSRNFLEFDHVVPRARGGTGDASNLRLRCRPHNRYAAEQAFGREHVDREIQRKRRERPTDDGSRAILQKALVGLGFRSSDADRALGQLQAQAPEVWSRPVEALLRDALAVLT